MKYEETTFWFLLNKYGKLRVIKSVDFILALVLAVIFTGLAIYTNLEVPLLKTTSPIFAAIGSGMIAIVIAALAILVSMSDNDFVYLLKESKMYDEILFIFWYVSILAGISIFIDVISTIFITVASSALISMGLVFITTFITSYAVFAVILAIGTVMRYGLYRGEFIRQKGK